jgi:hypothetical protein
LAKQVSRLVRIQTQSLTKEKDLVLADGHEESHKEGFPGMEGQDQRRREP